MAETEGAKAAIALTNYANGMGHSIEDFVDQMTLVEHRTLQQRVMALFLGFVEAQAGKKEGRFDLRNEDTVKLCRKIKERLDEDGLGLSLHKLVRFI